jgi:hypothetical protein
MSLTPIYLLSLSLVFQPDGLSVKNDRFTNGPLGSTRAASQFLPGDVLVLTFDIDGLKFDDSGKASYSLEMEVADAKDKVHFRQEPRTQQALSYLGGSSLPCVAHVQVGFSQPAGEYKLKVKVTDQTTKASKSLEKKFEILPPAFGLVQVGMSADVDGAVPAPPGGAVGGTLFLNFAAVGFGRDKTRNQPYLTVEMRILDENGKPTTAKPITGEARGSFPEDIKTLPMQFGISLTKEGRYTVELVATDKTTGKSAKVTLPLVAVTVK